jgi:hypothetical protein
MVLNKTSISEFQAQRIKEQTLKSNIKTSNTVFVQDKKRKVNPISRPTSEPESKKMKE